MRPLFVLFLAVLMIVAFGSTRVDADDPVSTNVSFNREILRIIQRKCEPCHTAGGLAFSLSDYRDARAWGRAIREELVEHRMPPPVVARGYGGYLSDPSLNTREMATFLTWLDGGMPQGDEADRPPKTNDVGVSGDAGTASVRLSLPMQTVPARENLVVRRVTVYAAAIANRSIARVELRPGNRRVLRGAIVFASNSHSASAASWIGAWLPWQHAVVPPSTHTFRLSSGSSLVVDLYYRGADTELTDRSEVDVIFRPQNAPGSIADVAVEATSDRSSGRMHGTVKLQQATTIWAVHPAFDASIASIELRAERPDKSVEVLLWMPTPNPDWPVALVMPEPLNLPAGSTVLLVAETKDQAGAGSPPRVTLSLLSRGR